MRVLPAAGRVLVSACLAGRECTHRGTDRTHPEVLRLVAEGRAVLVCPEQEAGLGTPRPEAEISEGSGADVLDQATGVRTIHGVDVTEEYIEGARIAVDRARDTGCATAVLKARSPACGCGQIYDGSFSGTLREGDGVTAAALRRAGVDVLSDEELKGGEQ
jgi:uncharacterized protein YbbK (DUF523 family)